ncbi:MAG: 2OG-Fe(II) oxygenase [Alphaproteobacteria bacterium]
MQTPYGRALRRGDPAPLFACETSKGRRFELYTGVRGGPVLLAVPGPDGAAMLPRLAACRAALAETGGDAYVMLSADQKRLRKAASNTAWLGEILVDNEDEIVRGYLGLTGASLPAVFVLDPNQRFFAILTGPGAMDAERVAAEIRAAAHADCGRQVQGIAPVLVIPRVLGPEFCADLIACWRDNPRTEGLIGTGVSEGLKGRVDRSFKRRLDYLVDDAALQAEILSRVLPRVGDQVQKVYHLESWTLEQFRIGCYKAEDSGFFRVHRDNANDTMRRRLYALTVNLNDDYEGGDLRFPEYGRQLFRPPLGGAIVFSCSLLHEVVPVTRGERFALLSFLYPAPS